MHVSRKSIAVSAMILIGLTVAACRAPVQPGTASPAGTPGSSTYDPYTGGQYAPHYGGRPYPTPPPSLPGERTKSNPPAKIGDYKKKNEQKKAAPVPTIIIEHNPQKDNKKKKKLCRTIAINRKSTLLNSSHMS